MSAADIDREQLTILVEGLLEAEANDSLFVVDPDQAGNVARRIEKLMEAGDGTTEVVLDGERYEIAVASTPHGHGPRWYRSLLIRRVVSPPPSPADPRSRK